MEENQIPKKLVEKYNLFKDDNLKYSFLEINNFENEVNKENSMLNSTKEFAKSLENIYSKIYDYISTNKNTFNNTCLENDVKSLDYLFLVRSTIYLTRMVISKLENTELKKETFQTIYDELYEKFPKIFIVQYPKNEPSLIKDLETTINLTIERAEDIRNSSNKPGIMITSSMVYYNLKYIVDLNNSLQKFEEIKDFKDNSFFNNQTKAHEIILFDALITLKKLLNINMVIYFSYFLDENDLMNKEEDSQEWKDVGKIVWEVKPKADIDIQKKLSEIYAKMRARMFQMSKMMKEGGGKLQMIGNLVGNLFSSNQEQEHDMKKNFIKLYGFGVEPPKRTYKMNPMMKKMISMRLPSIKCRKKLYIRKEFKPITLEYIKELNDFMNGKISEPKDKNILLFNNFIVPEEISKKKLFATQLEKIEKDYYISTRIMNDSPLIFKGEINNTGNKNEFNNAIIIHINGGGFRSNNGFMMERYQRKWAKDMGVAVITIKKPEKEEDVYPATLNQFYQVYMWLMEHAKEELNMDIKKIIFSGDSAGGNLAMSFLFLLIGIKLFEKKDIKIPDLILMEYPNVTLEINKVMLVGNSYNYYDNNSVGIGFNDSFFRNLIEHYLGEFKDYKNMFVSPLYASDKMIENIPRIRFFLGDKDLSRDMFLRAIYKFKNCKDIRAYNFLHLYHAFNGIDDPEIFEMVKDFIIEEVKDILHN